MEEVSQDVKDIKTWIAEHDNNDDKKAKPTRESPPFSSYIKDGSKAPQLLEYLHDKIASRKRVDALIFIQAAIDAGALTIPPYAASEAEFPGHMGSDSLYNDYVGNEGAFSTRRRIQQLADAVEEIRKL